MTAVHISEPLLQALWKFRYFCRFEQIQVIFWKSFYRYPIIFLSLFRQDSKAMFPTQTYPACKAVTGYLCSFFKHLCAIKSPRIYNFYTENIKNAFAR